MVQKRVSRASRSLLEPGWGLGPIAFWHFLGNCRARRGE
jgi:hypothetical protein